MKNKLQKCRFSNLKSITAKFFLMFAAFTASQQVFAQFVDDFSDGDFTSDPLWLGSDPKFVVDSSSLRLKAIPSTDVAYLATASKAINDATWEFLVRLDFNPSASNFVRIYVVSDNSDLSSSLNGYFVQIGNTTDDVTLYKQTGTSITRIIDGPDGKLDLAKVIVRIKVARDRDGTWAVYTDHGASGNYVIEGTSQDAEHPSSMFFGFLCGYTSTRTDKFYFDDVSVTGEGVSDLTPPEVTNIETLSVHQLQLTFSEEIEAETAIDRNNYSINGLGQADDAILDSSNGVVLTFVADFVEEVSYIITISGVRDKFGNEMNVTQKTFRLLRSIPVQFKDIIFTEIFADPLPKVALPDAEFVEIYNRSENSISLEGWSLSDGSSKVILSDIILLPAEFLIVTSNSSLFSTDLKSYGSPDFPSLNNSDDHLILRHSTGNTIDSLHYSADWYRNNQKKEGGWSLELIDPENDCAEAENWIASEHPSGGTPGIQNSAFANKPDLSGPVLLSVIPVSPHIIRLVFNEKLQAEIPSSENFVIDPVMMVKSVSFSGQSHTELLIELASELTSGISYSIAVNSIADCAGNRISEASSNTIFGLPEAPIPSDILINEILFDPRPAGVDFVEIVNASNKFFNLKNWRIGNFEHDTITNALEISGNDLLLAPGGYLALTEDLDALKGDYPSAHEPNVFEVDKLPSFNDDAGSIAVAASNGLVVDSFNYSKSLHSIFIKDPEGVSLERIAFGIPTNDIQNWKSSSTMSGYATPGYLNSNSRNDLHSNIEPIRIEPEVFVPLNGQPDFVRIHYDFDRGGYVANVTVLDAQGHPVKHLVNNEILGMRGAFRWDGDRDDGHKIRVGYYLVLFEVFDATGEVRTFFNRVAVATRF
jgi:hypothetical protein